ADLEARRFALVLLVLRRGTDRRELEDAIAGADPGRSLHDGVRPDDRAGPDHDARPDHRVGTHFDTVRQLRVRCDRGRGVNDRRHRSLPWGVANGPQPGITIISAEQTSAPSTSATVAYFQIVRMRRSSVALSTS